MKKNRHTEYLNLKNLKFYLSVFLVVFIALGFLAKFNTSKQNRYKNLEPVFLFSEKPIWEEKINTEQEVRIGIITDTHLRSTRINKSSKDPSWRYIDKGDIAPLNRFNQEMTYFQPDAIIHLGDIIEGTDDSEYIGMSSLELTKKELEKSGVPIFAVVGNHDLRSVSKEQFRVIFGLEELNYVKDMGDYRFIFLDSNYNPKNADKDFEGEGYLPGFVPPRNLSWLEEQLKTDKRVYVFMHHAVLDQISLGEGQLAKNHIFNNEPMKDMLQKYKVEAFFSGHIESKYYKELNGVKYYSLPGTKKNLEYPLSYYELTLKNGNPDLAMFYSDPKTKKEEKMNFETNEPIKK